MRRGIATSQPIRGPGCDPRGFHSKDAQGRGLEWLTPAAAMAARIPVSFELSPGLATLQPPARDFQADEQDKQSDHARLPS